MTSNIITNDVTYVEDFSTRRQQLRANYSFTGQSIDNDTDDDKCSILEIILQALSIIVLITTFPLSLLFTVKIVNEFERLVLFRFGRITSNSPKGPGFHILLPWIDCSSKVDLRIYNFIVPIKEIVLKDSVCITIEAVVWAKVSSVISAVTATEDYYQTSKMFSAAVVRKVLGSRTLSDVVNDSKFLISKEICSKINAVTIKIGVRVERIDLKNISLPKQLQRVMASEGIAAREAKAMYLFADGERASAGHLTAASGRMDQTALSLRYMQTLNTIQGNTDQGSKLFYPIPIDFGWTTWNRPRGMYHKYQKLPLPSIGDEVESGGENNNTQLKLDIDDDDDGLKQTIQFVNETLNDGEKDQKMVISGRKPRKDHEYFDVVDVTVHEAPPSLTSSA